MIAYLKGTLLSLRDDRLVLLTGGIGYEILVPGFVMREIKGTTESGQEMSLHISFNQTERQPKPILVGFRSELDKEFFEHFISVEDIGPAAAIRALVKPVREIARAIEEKDIRFLRQLKGIGERKAEKIVATLRGKVAKYALIPEVSLKAEVADDFKRDVEHVLVTQLGHKLLEARKMIGEALKRSPSIASSEELFEEVYRGEKK